MKRIIYLLLVVTLSISACKSKKDLVDQSQDLEQYDNFNIGKIHYDVANHLNLSSERSQEYFDILIHTEKMAQALDAINPSNEDRTFGLKEIKIDQLEKLNALFTKDEIIAYNKFMKSYRDSKQAAKRPETVDKGL